MMQLRDLARGLTPPVLWSALSRMKSFLAWRGDKPVPRIIRGTILFMDPKHALPSYVATYPLYDTALPAFASFLVRRRARPITIIDVGANIGDTSALIAAAIGGDNARFICIEADAHYITLLRRNTEQFNAKIIHGIAGRSSGQVNLRATRSGTGTSKLVADKAVQRPMISVDDMDCDHADILKIDTDGFELDVLEGASKTLQTADTVFVEYSPRNLREFGKHEPGQLVDFMIKHDFHTALAYDNFGVPIGLLRDGTLKAICDYVDLQRLTYLDLLFCRDEQLLAEFAVLESERAKMRLMNVP
jgi:FkbM family methyltransferase